MGMRGQPGSDPRGGADLHEETCPPCPVARHVVREEGRKEGGKEGKKEGTWSISTSISGPVYPATSSVASYACTMHACMQPQME